MNSSYPKRVTFTTKRGHALEPCWRTSSSSLADIPCSCAVVELTGYFMRGNDKFIVFKVGDLTVLLGDSHSPIWFILTSDHGG
jgi:hypothetical protein